MLSTKQEWREEMLLRHRVIVTFGGNRLNAGASKLRGKRREFKEESSCKCGISSVFLAENPVRYRQKPLALPHESNDQPLSQLFGHLGKAG